MNESDRQPSRAPYPSRVTLPAADPPYLSLLEFLDKRFPKVGRVAWDQRLQNGQVVDATGQPVDCNTPYQPGLQLAYFREVNSETLIPFEETVIFNNKHVLISCKPHFLPVVPAGKYVNECLLYRLRQKTGLEALVPLHRLDRETAGLVLFSTNKKTRGKYGELFEKGLIEKDYEAIGSLPTDKKSAEKKEKREWLIESRIEASSHWLVMANVEGKINARTKIKLIQTNYNQARFQLHPLTGKQHQLRLHLNLIGSQITNDRFYPVLLPEQEREKPDFDRPLKLLAKRLSFVDPLSGERMTFESQRTLEFD